MEFAEKGDILGRINENKQKKKDFEEEELWQAIKCIVKGLRDLHRAKIIHRDIKTANLFVTSNNKIKIGDLNVSKLAKQGLAKTQTGTP